MFEQLRRAINDALNDVGDRERLMRDAIIEAKVSLQKMREGLSHTELELATERRSLQDTERRLGQAQRIQDADTVEIAQRFVTKHVDRVQVLEQKRHVQRAELALAAREIGEMRGELDQLKLDQTSESTSRAWRELENLGASRFDLDEEHVRAETDRAQREQLVDDQLEALKRKMRGD